MMKHARQLLMVPLMMSDNERWIFSRRTVDILAKDNACLLGSNETKARDTDFTGSQLFSVDNFADFSRFHLLLSDFWTFSCVWCWECWENGNPLFPGTSQSRYQIRWAQQLKLEEEWGTVPVETQSVIMLFRTVLSTKPHSTNINRQITAVRDGINL